MKLRLLITILVFSTTAFGRLVTPFFSLSPPKGWTCQAQPNQTWTCAPGNGEKEKLGSFLVTVSRVDAASTLKIYESQLRQLSKADRFKRKRSRGVVWLETTGPLGEIPGFRIRYLAAVEKVGQAKMCVLLSFLMPERASREAEARYDSVAGSLSINRASAGRNLARKLDSASAPEARPAAPAEISDSSMSMSGEAGPAKGGGNTLAGKQCDGGTVASCLARADEAFKAGRYLEAKRLSWLVCERNVGMGCTLLGMTEEKIGKPADVKNAYERSCDLGDVLGCSQLAFLELEANNRPRAKSLFISTCDSGNLVGCRMSGLLEFKESRMVSAAQYFRKGCRAGDSESCGYMEKLNVK